MSKKDYLKECMNSIEVKSTVEEFKMAFCDVCLNPECTRSQWSDSEWLARMTRQETALNHPIFASASDPRFAGIAAQNFVPVDAETREYYGGWVDVSEDGKVVHHANPPSENKPAKKVDDALAFLKRRLAGDEEFVDEQRTVPAEDVPFVEEPVVDPEIEVEKDLAPVEAIKIDPAALEPEPEPDVREAPPSTRSTDRRNRPRNTEVPQGGVLLKPDGTPLQSERPSQLLTKEDPWAAPKERTKSGGKLTVRISDGEVIKKD